MNRHWRQFVCAQFYSFSQGNDFVFQVVGVLHGKQVNELITNSVADGILMIFNSSNYVPSVWIRGTASKIKRKFRNRIIKGAEDWLVFIHSLSFENWCWQLNPYLFPFLKFSSAIKKRSWLINMDWSAMVPTDEKIHFDATRFQINFGFLENL